jgi:hypothetical protein
MYGLLRKKASNSSRSILLDPETALLIAAAQHVAVHSGEPIHRRADSSAGRDHDVTSEQLGVLAEPRLRAVVRG